MGHESALDEHGGHAGRAQDGESRTLHSAIEHRNKSELRVLDGRGQHVVGVVVAVAALGREAASREVGVMAVRRAPRRESEDLVTGGEGIARA